ncbi:heterodisulfide reductase-related iron-sulfur binding cluster [Kytococcus schroeteri]|uniref:heterodisulfide reductase-related iron-sulfur binding cluster n=1 Tax=Kytococcus schroeteri TaxID=138300 RepID=UPI00192DEE2B|nr:heterodisulfide reductase-related iron-sulfur binding cluster [Kytococcus schroeteri]
MHPLQLLAILLGLAVTAVGIALLTRAVMRIVAVVRQGQAAVGRFDDPVQRTKTMLYEVFAHPRMLRKKWVAIAHWFTMISFGVLFLTLVNAYGQLFDARFALPLIGHFPPFEWLTEFFAWTGLFGIVYLIWLRQRTKPSVAAREKGNERRSRFWGSTFWQAYHVEFTILAVVLCILALRALEFALGRVDGEHHASALHFPLTAWMGQALTGLSAATLAGAIIAVALLKILVSMAWMITIGLQPTMGVAWHRFLAFFNIWFKRHADGRTSLGELQPMMVKGKPLTDMEQLEELYADEEEDGTEGAAEPSLGVGRIEDFTWKGLLDFTTCTECGRCQEQCPAWNTDKPLSPKMLVMNLRDAAYAQAPWQTATQPAGTGEGADGSGATPMTGTPEDFDIRQLVGPTEGDPTRPTGGAVIDPDVLWSCTSCGACVEQCPVDIEHVDAIVDMRRNQVLIESAFPSELGGLFKNLESKQNPWGMANSTRMDWAKDLDFEVKQVGADVESLSEVEYLFWVGCAGAFEDRAKKTTQAVAELLNIAGVDFAVLGDGEACTGDSARRAGNEVLYQMLAQQNVEMLNEVGATKIVVTCAHCFNTIKNEYPQNGGKYEVVHHTQLLNRLVREKRLQPVAASEVAEPSKVASSAPSVTYHDPCYLGRHNQVYEAPRELIATLPGVEYREMERSKEKSFCCGAGGARMWMEEKLGSRINVNRTEEAIDTGAERIAIGCPFCRVMMSDGLTAAQEEGRGKDVEVVDVAQMLLAGVRRGQETEAGAVTDELVDGTTTDGAASDAETQRIQIPDDISELTKAGSSAAAGAALASGSGSDAGSEGDEAASRVSAKEPRESDGDDAEGPVGSRVDEDDRSPEGETTVDEQGAVGQVEEDRAAGEEPADAVDEPAAAGAPSDDTTDATGTAGATTGDAAAGAATAAGGTAPQAFTGDRIGADTPTRFGWASQDGAPTGGTAASASQTAPAAAAASDADSDNTAAAETATAAATGDTADGTTPEAGAPAPAGPSAGTAPAAFTGQRIGVDTPTRFGWATDQAAGAPSTSQAAAPATEATVTPGAAGATGTGSAPAGHGGDRIGGESPRRFGWATGTGGEQAEGTAPAAAAQPEPTVTAATQASPEPATEQPSESAVTEQTSTTVTTSQATPAGTATPDDDAAPAASGPISTAPAGHSGDRIGLDSPQRFGWATGRGSDQDATEGEASTSQAAVTEAAGPSTSTEEPTPTVSAPADSSVQRTAATAPQGHTGTTIGADSASRFGWAQGGAQAAEAEVERADTPPIDESHAPVTSTGVMQGDRMDDIGQEQQPQEAADRQPQEVVDPGTTGTPAVVSGTQVVEDEASVNQGSAEPTATESAAPEADASEPPATGGAPVEVPNVGERASRIGADSPALRLGAWKG